jgi:hypothetical protein
MRQSYLLPQNNKVATVIKSRIKNSQNIRGELVNSAYTGGWFDGGRESVTLTRLGVMGGISRKYHRAARLDVLRGGNLARVIHNLHSPIASALSRLQSQPLVVASIGFPLLRLRHYRPAGELCEV